MEARQQPPEFIVKEINFKLSDEELLTHAKECALLNRESIELQEELDGHKSRIKNLMQPKAEKIIELLEMIDTRLETRSVSVEVRKNFGLGIVEYIFEGDVVQTRNMDTEDRQLNLVKSESAVGYESQDEDVRDVMEEEQDTRKKKDHIVGSPDEEMSDAELDPMTANIRTLTNLTEAET